MSDFFDFLKHFDLNDFSEQLRRRRPAVYDVLSILGQILRALWRLYLPMALCFLLMNRTLAVILEDARREVTHFLPLILIAVILPFQIIGDRRLQYDALRRRRGVLSPSVGHDLGMMFSSFSFWIGMGCCVLVVVSNVPYLAVEFARMMPEADFATHGRYAALFPTAALVLYYFVWWWIAIRFAYRCVDPDDEVEPVRFASLGRTLINGFAWVFGLLLAVFVGERAIVYFLYTAVVLLVKYWEDFLVVLVVSVALLYVLRAVRALRIRRSSLEQLRREMDAAGLRYEFEKHPILSVIGGGEKISLRIFLDDEVLSVRIISSLKRKRELVVAPDGNIGFLHSIALFRVPIRSSRVTMTATGREEEESPALTQWMIKRKTAFEDERYPQAEKIYLINPTPTDWRMGELKRTKALNDGDDAYGYRMWTVSAFCRHLRLRSGSKRRRGFE